MLFFQDIIKNIYSLMAKSDLFVFPSYGDSWGRVVVEAMLSGLPVIGANAGGIPEIITDGQTGFLANPKDPADWAEKIAWVYNNYDHALKLAENAKKICQPDLYYRKLCRPYRKNHWRLH